MLMALIQTAGKNLCAQTNAYEQLSTNEALINILTPKLIFNIKILSGLKY